MDSFNLLLTVVGLTLIFEFSNGWHDAANSIATVVSTRVLTPFRAVAWAAFWNFVAAFVFGTAVAKTIGKGMVHKIPRASPRSLVVRFIAEQIRSSGFLGGSLCHIYSQAPRSERPKRSTVLRFTVSAHHDANPSLHSISIGPASAAPAASFKRLYRTRAEHRVQLRALEKRASDKALTSVGTNPKDEPTTSGLPVIQEKRYKMASRAVGNQNEIGGKNMSSAPATGPSFNQDSLETLKAKASTYTAVEVSAPNQLRVVERRVVEPGPGQVRIRVEACGICHTDMTTVTGTYPGLTLPRVPGHEVIGRIEALGSGVSKWKIGQRVGVGLIAGEDGVCESCRRGDPVNCQNPVTSGVTLDGGYAEVMIAEARGIASIPDELSSAEAAPLLCAGVTTYNALRNAGLRAGDLVAVQGIGGLGHLGVQFARHMGFRTVAIGRGRDKERLAQDLGAHAYIDAAVEDGAAALQRMGGARAILATGTSGAAIGPLVSGLAARGKLIVVGAPADPIQLNALSLLFGGRSVYGSLTGTPIDSEDALAFSVLANIRPKIETVPLEQAADAYDRMMQGKARFRIVLVTKDGFAQSPGRE